MNPRGWLLLLLLITTRPATAEQGKSLAGRWSASTLRTTWTIAQWGDACGPKPIGESVPGGIVAVTSRGNEISIDGLGRNYVTNGCWELIPGQRITSHGASGRAWSTTCQSAAGDPRRATITTTLSASDDRIDLAESGQYEFIIEGQICQASMRRNRTYSLVEREGETRPSPTPPPTAPLPMERSEPRTEERLVNNCTNPGPPARLEVRPSRKLLRAGDEYSFHGRVLDRSGCVIDRPLAWRLLSSTTQLDVAVAGVVRVAKEATEGTATLTASIQDRSVQVTVDVVSEARYQALLLAGNFDDRGETRESAVVTIASADVGTKTAVLEARARGRRLIFVAVVGVVAFGLAGAALWMALGKNRRSKPIAAAPDALELPDPDAADATLVCPTCHEQYPPGTMFCATDGERLVALPVSDGLEADPEAAAGVCPICHQGFEPGVTVCPIHDEILVLPGALAARQATPMPTPRRICPICGTVYGAEHQYCGNDGAALVQIN